MIIDIHTHVFPDEVAPRAISALSENSGGIKANYNGTINGLLNSMNESGVDISILQPVATKQNQSKSINAWQRTINNKRIKHFGALHPKDTNFEAILKELKESGVPGIKLHPD